MNILSLFDGVSCGRLALEGAGIKVDKYFASEIDKYAIQIAKKNYPDTIHVGSVLDIGYCDGALFSNNIDSLPIKIENWCSKLDVNIDMVIGGSPCQDLSIAKKDGKGLQGEKSSLFFEYVRLLKEVRPKYFLLENVASMKKADKEEITRILTEIYPDTQCYLINSALVSAQNRKRLYWTNIQGVEQPEDKCIVLKDILEKNVDGSFVINRDGTEKYKSNTIRTSGRGSGIDDKHNWDTIRVGQFNSGGQGDRVYSPEGKSVSLSANGGGRGAKTGLYAVALTERRTEEAKQLRKEHREKTGKDFSPRRGKELVPREDEKMNTITTGTTKESLILQDHIVRKLTPIECERLQTLPDNWTEGISNTQRYKAIGNGWTVDVIAHIFSYIKP